MRVRNETELERYYLFLADWRAATWMEWFEEVHEAPWLWIDWMWN